MGGRGQKSIGKREKNTPKSEYDSVVNELATAMNNPEDGLSNGDMQAVVEAYAIQHPEIDEDAMMDAVRRRADALERERIKSRQREDKAREEYSKIAPKIPAAEGLVTRRKNALTLAKANLKYFDRKSYEASGRIKEMKAEIAEREKAVKAAEKKLKEAEKKRDDLYKKRNAAIRVFQPSYFRNGGSTGVSNDEDIPF